MRTVQFSLAEPATRIPSSCDQLTQGFGLTIPCLISFEHLVLLCPLQCRPVTEGRIIKDQLSKGRLN
jgi:hypothetical protein